MPEGQEDSLAAGDRFEARDEALDRALGLDVHPSSDRESRELIKANKLRLQKLGAAADLVDAEPDNEEYKNAFLENAYEVGDEEILDGENTFDANGFSSIIVESNGYPRYFSYTPDGDRVDYEAYIDTSTLEVEIIVRKKGNGYEWDYVCMHNYQSMPSHYNGDTSEEALRGFSQLLPDRIQWKQAPNANAIRNAIEKDKEDGVVKYIPTNNNYILTEDEFAQRNKAMLKAQIKKGTSEK